MRELQQFFLERNGCVVEFADDGVAALTRAQREAPALVITEILVQGIDGLTLCRRLRDDPATAAVPVMVFSILAASARAEEAGAVAFVRKPLVGPAFVASVRDAIAAQSPAIVEQ